MVDKPLIDNQVLEFMAYLRTADPELRGGQAAQWLDQLQAQHERLNGVLDWCLAHNRGDLGLEMAGAVWPFWLQRGHLKEGRAWLARILATSNEPSLGRARSLAGDGTLAFFQGDVETSAQRLQASLVLYEKFGYSLGIAEAHSGLSRIAMTRGEPHKMRQHSQAALEVARATGNEAGMAMALHHLAHAALMDGDLDQAERRYAENIETYRAMRRYDLVTSELHNLGHVACLQGQPDRARPLFVESLRLGEETGNQANQPYNIIGLGRVAAALGRYETAATLIGAGMAILQAQGKAVVPLLRPAIEETLAVTRTALSAEAFETASQQGRGLSTVDAVQMVMSL